MLHKVLSLVGSLLTKNKLSIMIFHQVLETTDEYRPGEPDKARFDWQMALISKYCNPISLEEGLALLKQGKLPANSVCVTFDDGYLNNYEVALPILKKHNIPATVFVASAYSDGENMFNDRVFDLVEHCPEKVIKLTAVSLDNETLPESVSARRALAQKIVMAIKYLPIEERTKLIDQLYQDNNGVVESSRMMTPAQIKLLSEAGVDIGCHTHHHPILAKLSADEVKAELEENKRLLESWINKPVTGFAYPNGKFGVDYNDETASEVEKLGFSYAVTTDWGYSVANTPSFKLPRFTPWDLKPWKFHTRLLFNLMSSKEQ